MLPISLVGLSRLNVSNIESLFVFVGESTATARATDIVITSSVVSIPASFVVRGFFQSTDPCPLVLAEVQVRDRGAFRLCFSNIHCPPLTEATHLYCVVLYSWGVHQLPKFALDRYLRVVLPRRLG